MRILVVEDDSKIAYAVKRGLEQASFAVDVVHDADSGLARATSGSYDAVVLDRMLPGSTNGDGILAKLRAEGLHTPVLMLTASDTVADRVAGLNAGADDYLVKPFAFDELLARLQALLRRPAETIGEVLRYRDLELDLSNRTVRRAGVPIDLTSKEFALLEYLARNAEQTVSKSSIIQHVWDGDADVLPNTVEVYIGYLRKKIDEPFKGRALVQTRRGFGYVLGGGAA